jgi:uncharacterized phage-like protein YoqJ
MIIAGTGHRPKFCPCQYDHGHPWLRTLKLNLARSLRGLDVKNVISGMAIGFDTWLAQAALDLEIPVHAYVPFKGQEEAWPKESRREYERIIKLSDVVLYLSDSYSNEAFLKRDRAMVDDCDQLFSLLNPEANSGGTFYTVKYAEKNNKPVTNFWY